MNILDMRPEERLTEFERQVIDDFLSRPLLMQGSSYCLGEGDLNYMDRVRLLGNLKLERTVAVVRRLSQPAAEPDRKLKVA